MDTPTGSSLIQRASNAGNMVAIVANNVVDKRFGQIKETVTGFARRSKPLKVLGRVFDYKRDSWSMIGKKLLVYGWDNPQRVIMLFIKLVAEVLLHFFAPIFAMLNELFKYQVEYTPSGKLQCGPGEQFQSTDSTKLLANGKLDLTSVHIDIEAQDEVHIVYLPGCLGTVDEVGYRMQKWNTAMQTNFVLKFHVYDWEEKMNALIDMDARGSNYRKLVGKIKGSRGKLEQIKMLAAVLPNIMDLLVKSLENFIVNECAGKRPLILACGPGGDIAATYAKKNRKVGLGVVTVATSLCAEPSQDPKDDLTVPLTNYYLPGDPAAGPIVFARNYSLIMTDSMALQDANAFVKDPVSLFTHMASSFLIEAFGSTYLAAGMYNTTRLYSFLLQDLRKVVDRKNKKKTKCGQGLIPKSGALNFVKRGLHKAGKRMLQAFTGANGRREEREREQKFNEEHSSALVTPDTLLTGAITTFTHTESNNRKLSSVSTGSKKGSVSLGAGGSGVSLLGSANVNTPIVCN